MKILLSILAVLLLACSNNSADHTAHQTTADTSKKSIPKEIKKWVGQTYIRISYHAPAVRGRITWGGLVPYDAVWVTGAHNATVLQIDRDFRAGGKIISRGKYALFTIPGKEEWTLIINKNWDQHLADEYSEADDVVRIKVKPQTAEELIERLEYEIDQTGERTATIIMRWEKLSVRFGIEIQ